MKYMLIMRADDAAYAGMGDIDFDEMLATAERDLSGGRDAGSGRHNSIRQQGRQHVQSRTRCRAQGHP